MGRYEEMPIEAVGTVVFLLFHVGTKSEAKVPFLYVSRDTMYALYLKGDNPFENEGFLPYDGKRVRVSGVKREDIKKIYAEGTLIADTVVPLDEPGSLRRASESGQAPVSGSESCVSGETPAESMDLK